MEMLDLCLFTNLVHNTWFIFFQYTMCSYSEHKATTVNVTVSFKMVANQNCSTFWWHFASDGKRSHLRGIHVGYCHCLDEVMSRW